MKSAIARNFWNLADQSVSSLTNLLIALFVARQTSQSDFGSFALAVSIYILTVLLSRAVCGQTLLISIAKHREANEVEALAASFLGLGFVFGVLGAAACGMTALFSGGALHRDTLALATVIVPLVVQDVARFVFFALEQPRKAFESDVSWLLIQLLLTFAVFNLEVAPSAVELVLAWGLGGVAAAAYAAFRLRLRARLADGLVTFWRNRRLCGQFALELLALSGGTQLLLYAVASILGRADVAALRGATVLFGPVTLLFSASRSGLLAHAARTAISSRPRLVVECTRISLLLGGVMSVLGIILSFLPTRVGEFLLGPTWFRTEPLMPAFALQFIVLALAEGPGIGLRALAASRQLLLIASGYACLSLGLGVLGALWFGVRGAAWGNAVSALLLLFGYILALHVGVSGDGNSNALSPSDRSRSP